MRRLAPVLWLLLVGASCAPPADDTSPTPGVVGGPGGVTRSDGGSSDGGNGDGGPSNCPSDPDGTSAGARVVVSELHVGSQPFIELHNGTSASVALSSLVFDGAPLPTFSATAIPAGGSILGTIATTSSGEIRIRSTATALTSSYFCWGNLGSSVIQNDAVTAGIWATPGVCTPLSGDASESLHLSGAGTGFGDWTAGRPTPLGCPR